MFVADTGRAIKKGPEGESSKRARIQAASRARTLYKKGKNRLQPRAEAVAELNVLDGLVDHLVDNDLCGKAVVDDGGRLAHEEGAGVVHHLVVEVVALALNVVLDGDLAGARQLLDLGLSVLLPVGDVGVVADAQRSALCASCQFRSCPFATITEWSAR